LWTGQMRVSKANEGLCSVAGKEEPTRAAERAAGPRHFLIPSS